MRRLLLPLSVVVLMLAACAGGSDSTADEQAATTSPAATTSEPQAPAASPPPSTGSTAPQRRLYKKAELSRLALQPSDAPLGMRYTQEESGPKTFFDVGIILDRQLKEARRLGMNGIYDVIFDSRLTDVRLASRLWLFKGDAGASRWLEQSRDDSTTLLQPASAPPLADGSWAARGNIGGSDVISHGFRTRNVVVVVTFSTQTSTLSESDALAAVQVALARVGRG